MNFRFPAAMALACIVITGGVDDRDEPVAAAVQSFGHPLPSWNERVRKAIVHFVWRVIREGGPDCVPSEARIAVFDNDGTLWSEQFRR